MRSIAICILMISFAAIAMAQTGTAAKPKFRSISIVTEPDTVIWVDNVRFGKTDSDGRLEITTIAPGSHMLKLRADGFAEMKRPLNALQKGEVKVTLKKTQDPAELAFQEGERMSVVDREKSAEAYRRAIAARPNYPDAYIALARVLTETGDLADASKAIASAQRLRPGSDEASAVEGRIYRESGEEAKAIAAFKRAITQGRGIQPEAYTGLGLLYKEKAEGVGGAGDFEQELANYSESAKYLKTALKQLSGAPDAIVIYQLLGLIYERTKQFDEAISVYEEFLEIFPSSIEATAVRSFIVQLKKQKDGQ